MGNNGSKSGSSPGTRTTRLRASQSKDIKAWLDSFPISGEMKPEHASAYAWVDSKGYPAMYPLHNAAMRGDISTVRELILEKNYDPNQKMTDWFDSTPMDWAASFGQLGTIIDLIKLGGDPLLPPNKAANTPLTNAVRERHENVVTFLREYEGRIRDYFNEHPEEEFEGAGPCVLCGIME